MLEKPFVSAVKRHQRAQRQTSDSVRAAMLIDDLLEQKAEEKDFQYQPETIRSSIEYPYDGQRQYSLHNIYTFATHSGLDSDKVYFTRHISCTGAVNSWNNNINLTNAEPVYASIPNNKNSGQCFIRECNITSICECPTSESSNYKTELVEAISKHIELTNEANMDVCKYVFAFDIQLNHSQKYKMNYHNYTIIILCLLSLMFHLNRINHVKVQK